jgi:hypothetical protein
MLSITVPPFPGDGVGDGIGVGVGEGSENGVLAFETAVVGPPPHDIRAKVARTKAAWSKPLAGSERCKGEPPGNSKFLVEILEVHFNPLRADWNYVKSLKQCITLVQPPKRN